jgi:hypothetical protein
VRTGLRVPTISFYLGVGAPRIIEVVKVGKMKSVRTYFRAATVRETELDARSTIELCRRRVYKADVVRCRRRTSMILQMI